jgi:hypothetical protein
VGSWGYWVVDLKEQVEIHLDLTRIGWRDRYSVDTGPTSREDVQWLFLCSLHEDMISTQFVPEDESWRDLVDEMADQMEKALA